MKKSEWIIGLALMTVTTPTLAQVIEIAPMPVEGRLILRGGGSTTQLPPEGDVAKNAREVKRAALLTCLLQDNNLVLKTDLPDNFPNHGAIRLSGIDEKPGLGWLTQSRVAHAENALYLTLNYYREDSKTPTLVVNAQPWMLQVNYTADNKKQTTYAFQQRGVPKGRRFELSRQDYKEGLKLDVREGETVLCTIETTNFKELRLKHARELQLFAMPMLKIMGAADAVYPQPIEVIQLLGKPPLVEAEEKRRIEAIVVKLDSDDADHREAASKELAATGWRGLIVTAGLDQKKLSVEQTMRIKSFREELGGLSEEEVTKLAADKHLLVNAIGVDDEQIAAAAFERLKKLVERPLAWEMPKDVAERREKLTALHELIAKP